MSTDQTTASHLSKEELVNILNEIDSDRQQDRTDTSNHKKETDSK